MPSLEKVSIGDPDILGQMMNKQEDIEVEKVQSNPKPKPIPTITPTQFQKIQKNIKKREISSGYKNEIHYKEKENDILRILKYQDSKIFGKHLQEDLKAYYTRDVLLEKTKNQIHSILTRIRLSLNNRHIDKMMDSMAVTLAIGVEKTVDPFYSCDGFSDNLLENPEFWSVFERYKIESGCKLPDIPPWLQMSYIVSSTLVLTHQLNKNKKPQPTMDPPDMSTLKDLGLNEPIQNENNTPSQKKEKSNLILGGKL